MTKPDQNNDDSTSVNNNSVQTDLPNEEASTSPKNESLKIRFCKECGNKLPKNSKYCPYCGISTTSDSTAAISEETHEKTPESNRDREEWSESNSEPENFPNSSENTANTTGTTKEAQKAESSFAPFDVENKDFSKDVDRILDDAKKHIDEIKETLADTKKTTEEAFEKPADQSSIPYKIGSEIGKINNELTRISSNSDSTFASIFQNKKYLFAVIVAGLLIFFAITQVVSCVNSLNSNVINHVLEETQQTDTTITIECRENLIFSRYDVNVFIDNESIGTVEHGTTKTFNTKIEKGSHTLRVEKEDDSSVDGSVDFEVSENESLRFSIHCRNDQVEIKLIAKANPPLTESEALGKSTDEVKQSFKNAGFESVTIEDIRDLDSSQLDQANTVAGITIEGSNTFTKEDKFDVDIDTIVIKSHQAKEINPPSNNKDLESKNYEEVAQIFKDAGFINIELKNTSTTKNKDEVDLVDKVTINGKSSFDSNSLFPLDSKVVINYYQYKQQDPVYYSTNTYEVAKKGNTGVFSYKEDGASYDIYWIIDFDEGYLYYFTEGNGNEVCDKVKISGNLNEKVSATWHEGNSQWTWYLHFHYVQNPSKLILEDHNGFEFDYRPTDLEEALKVRDTKRIVNY